MTNNADTEVTEDNAALPTPGYPRSMERQRLWVASKAFHAKSNGLEKQKSINTQWKSLQQILLPERATVDSLYLRLLEGHYEITENTLCMEKGTKVSFNTFFNSFYESYWSNISCVNNLCLELSFVGSITIEVFRDTRSDGCHRIGIARLNANTPETQMLQLDGFSPIGEGGRLFVDIIAHKKSQVSGLCFKTTTRPRRQPKISIGICTFNREQFLLRNLLAILDLPAPDAGIEKIVIVNQGTQFALPELVELVRGSDRILLVEQRNLGGCGGFTRTMYEALKLEGVSHHVLMDDDAVIDARVLQNLLSLLHFINDNVVVGGHMLDLLRPHFLYEAGALVGSNTRIRPLHHNIDLRAVDSLIPFNKYHSVDYNAWWFCAIPVEHIRLAEFPVPIFIRGDDMEYGLRLQERGVTTVAMPGIAVWHEPFYVKVGSWQTYYDLRNRLILASTYPHRFQHESPLDLLWWMLKAAASHDYLTAALLAKAVRDFLQGPAVLEKGADAIHAEIVVLAKSLAQPNVPENQLPPPPAKLRRMPKSDLGLGVLVVSRIIQNLLFVRKGGATLLLDHEANLSNIGPRAYVKTNSIGSYRLRFEPYRLSLIRSLKESFGAWFAYCRQRREAADTWRQQVPKFRTPGLWQEIFQTETARREAVG